MADELRPVLSGRVSTRDQDRVSYSRDLWTKGLLWIRQGRIPNPPDLVVWPETEEEVVRVINIARAHRTPVIPFGAGSGVCGATWAVKGGITLDLKRFDWVGKVDEEHRTVEAGAGIIGEVLERRLNEVGYSLGHFPSSIYMSTLGGWIAARSAGQFSNKYGKIEDMVLSVTAVTGAGEVVRTPERPYAGPDLAQLFAGSEGTLCAITQAKLRVHPLAEHRTYRGLRFRTVADGVEAIRQVYRAGLRPAVVRLYDPFDTALVGRDRPHKPVVAPSLRSTLNKDIVPLLLRRLAPKTLGHPALLNRATDLLKHCLLVLLFEGEARRAVREDEQAKAICERFGGTDLGEQPGRNWYAKRYAVSYKMSRIVDAGAYADTMEVAATWDKVMDVYDRVREAMAPFCFVLCHFSHAYLEGCSLYFTFTSSDESEADMEGRYDQAWKVVLQAAVSAGATVTHHHGVGILKETQMLEELGDGRRLLAQLKKTFDPDGIMNPGKLGQ